MTKDNLHQVTKLVSYEHAVRLRRISMQLRRWHERECTNVERDENTGKCFEYNERTGKRYPCRDMETPALKRLNLIMAQYPALKAYVQTDPRGCALYLVRPNDVPEGGDINAYYSRGIAVY